MEVIEIAVSGLIGKPLPVGHIGTLTIDSVSESGRVAGRFVLSRRAAKKKARRSRGPVFDIHGQIGHDTGTS